MKRKINIKLENLKLQLKSAQDFSSERQREFGATLAKYHKSRIDDAERIQTLLIEKSDLLKEMASLTERVFTSQHSVSEDVRVLIRIVETLTKK